VLDAAVLYDMTPFLKGRAWPDALNQAVAGNISILKNIIHGG
jgi:hypothetical protein